MLCWVKRPALLLEAPIVWRPSHLKHLKRSLNIDLWMKHTLNIEFLNYGAWSFRAIVASSPAPEQSRNTGLFSFSIWLIAQYKPLLLHHPINAQWSLYLQHLEHSRNACLFSSRTWSTRAIQAYSLAPYQSAILVCLQHLELSRITRGLTSSFLTTTTLPSFPPSLAASQNNN